MSDTSQGPGWWLASDGKWYPPELWTGPPGTRPDAGVTPTIPDANPVTYPSSTGSAPASPVGSAVAQPSSTRPGQPENTVPPGSIREPAYPGQPPAYPQQTYGSGAPGADPYAGYGYPPGQYGQYGYPPGQYGQYGQSGGYPTPARKTNGLAVASLVCGIGGFLFFIPLILAVVFGFVARAQIRQSNGAQGGQGMATAGIILGFAWAALFIVIFIASAVTTNNNNGAVLAHLAALGGLDG
jgi:Domain of unknown function (DUF4190)